MMVDNIFAYGTLMFSEIVKALTGKIFEVNDAVLIGYERYKSTDPARVGKYGPAIIQKEGSRVKGKILYDVDSDSMKIFDLFEGEYEKKIENVFVGKDIIKAHVYVGKNFKKEYLTSSWDPAEFKEKYLEYYIKKRVPFFLSNIKH